MNEQLIILLMMAFAIVWQTSAHFLIYASAAGKGAGMRASIVGPQKSLFWALIPLKQTRFETKSQVFGSDYSAKSNLLRYEQIIGGKGE